MILKWILFILKLIIEIKISINFLNFYQQAHYHLNSFKKIICNFYFKSIDTLFLYLVVFLELISNNIIKNTLGIIFLGGYLLLNKCLKKKTILKLKYTKRIVRQIIVEIISSLFIFYYYWHLYIVIFIPLLIFIVSFFMKGIEGIIFVYYKKKCQKKIKKINPIIIAITGSYGKTTTKNILYELLKEDYVTFKTERSFNTLKGICLSVNKMMKMDTEVAIFEYGASHKNDIKKLVKLLQPDIAIVTEIGPQHLETFNSLENIINEKMFLAKSAKKISFLNFDNFYIKNYQLNEKKYKSVGSSKIFDFYAQNITYNRFGINFQVINKNETYFITSELLGRHNIVNFLLAIGVAEFLGVKKNRIELRAKKVECVEHRLEIKKGKDIIIDDSFNSNIKGFINALEVLRMFDGFKVLITPGIVEGGKKSKEINEGLVSSIMTSCDFVFLVKNKASEFIYEKLIKYGYKNVKMVDSFKEAYFEFEKNEKEKVLLIENDISDIYKL